MPINELRAIATFAKAVELGSLRQAALSQGVSPQAASQAVAHLEQHLGVRLLHRTTRSLALTEEGQRFLQDTQPALAALDRALNLARDSREGDRKSTRLNSSHLVISYAVFCLKKKKPTEHASQPCSSNSRSSMIHSAASRDPPPPAEVGCKAEALSTACADFPVTSESSESSRR